MIYTVTPNPALDLSGNVSRLVPNEKNYVYAERRDPGGNGINSARIIHRLGQVPVVAIGFAGGATGQEVKGLLEKEGVPTRFTRIAGHTRINVTANNDEDHRQTRLTFPGPKISRDECAALVRQVSKLRPPGLFIVSGSLPSGAPGDFHSRLVTAARERGLGVIADVPAKYMSSLAPRKRNANGSRLLFIKPNQVELEEWAGRKLESDEEIIAAGKEMLQLASLVCVSLAERGALLLSEHRVWMGFPPKIKARGTVGAGDSMVGAFSMHLVRAGIFSPENVEKTPKIDDALENALAWGLAAGAATAESQGTSLAKASEIRRLRKKVKIKRLL